MSEKRKLSIGITVNLENYENLKVEVEGEAKDGRDAGELIEYLDSVLSRFGRNDPETKKRIDNYRGRVLENPGEPVITSLVEEESYPEHEIQPTPADPLIPVSEPAREKPSPEEKPVENTGFTCSSCGRPISKAEEQLSQIFMGRSLCKKCLEEMQK
jgi:formylmethanofuran dehydrogenase subunit E